MRKKSIVLLCIALCLTMIIPASAKKGGGGQSPSTVTISGDVDYVGPAKVHDSTRYFSLTIGVEGKNKLVEFLEYSVKWPGAFSLGTLDSSKSFFSIHYERDGSYDVVTCSLDESWVLKAYGAYDFKPNAIDPTKTDLTITISTGGIEYFTHSKRGGLEPAVPDPQADFPIEFTVTFG